MMQPDDPRVQNAYCHPTREALNDGWVEAVDAAEAASGRLVCGDRFDDTLLTRNDLRDRWGVDESAMQRLLEVLFVVGYNAVLTDLDGNCYCRLGGVLDLEKRFPQLVGGSHHAFVAEQERRLVQEQITEEVAFHLWDGRLLFEPQRLTA